VLESGNYKLAFDTSGYQSDNHVETLFPVIEITFRVRDGESQFHLPLLLSPHGYTTYRGS
jgi:5-hydroxyisourate hydrolase